MLGGLIMKTYAPKILSAVVLWSFLEAPVYAYLDPGSGSMLLQLLLGGVAAVGVVSKLYWHRVTSIFRRKNVGGESR